MQPALPAPLPLAFPLRRPRNPGEIAQLVEHTTENRGVPGSNPGLAIALSLQIDASKKRCAAAEARLLGDVWATELFAVAQTLIALADLFRA
jgi:hypothetical protein